MFNVGDKVMMMEEEPHALYPDIYPPKGTIGIVVDYSLCDETALVNWGKGSGVEPNDKDEYAWWCGEKRLEKVSANAQEEEANMNKFNVGDKVVFINAQKHKSHSRYYPAVGTVGTVVDIDEHPIEDFGLMVNWGDAKGVDVWQVDGTKSWWCNEADVKPYICDGNDCTDDEVWEMLKPKMRQLVPAYIEDIDMFSPTVKDMVVAAYRSGYGRATKGRSFMIKPPVKKAIAKADIDDSIDAVLGGKMIVTFYKDDNSYKVANFAYSCDNGKDVEIYGDIIHCSAGDSWTFGYDIISDPDCEMYVAIPFSEAMGNFNGDSIKAMYGEDKTKVLRYNNIKPWAIGEFNGFMRVSNETRAFMKFNEDNNSQLYPEIHRPEFKALVPICEYLRVNGVNV